MRRIIDFLGGVCIIVVFGIASVITYWQLNCDNCTELKIDVYLGDIESKKDTIYLEAPIIIQPVNCE